MKKYLLEMNHGQDQRHVEADQWAEKDGWLVFYRVPAIGGRALEYWRVRLAHVVCLETKP